MKRHIIVVRVSLGYLISICFVSMVFTVLGKLTEPIYENVPLPWNSKEVRSSTSSVQSTQEIKLPSSKVPLQQVQPVKEEDVVAEKQLNEVTPTKNNGLDMNSSSVSLQVASTSAIHSAEQSFGNYNILYK